MSISTETSISLMSFDEASAAVVSFLKGAVPMGFWSISRVGEGRQTYLTVEDDAYGLGVGDGGAWSESLCQRMVSGEAPQIAPEAMAVPAYASAEAAQRMQIGAYVGVPIRAGDGSLFGTLFGLDPTVQSPRLLEQAPVFRMLADLLGRVLETEKLRADAEEQADELRRQTSALARSETLHRVLAEVSADVISRHAPDGRFLYVSRAAQDLLGIPPEELLGTHPAELVHPDDRTDLLGDEAGRPGEEVPEELTFRMRHRDGQWVWVESTRSVLRDSRGEITEIQMATRDITQRRAREAEYQRESKLESLGRLSAGLAHEINTPIQYVGDNARFLEEAYQELIRVVEVYRALLDTSNPIGWAERQERVREAEAGIDFEYLEEEIPSAVAQTLQGIDRVATIVRAMKTFSHPGHQEQAPADLNEALAATITVTRHQVSDVADLHLELGELPPVVCNIADLNQVFLNLTVNAADAIEETGRRGSITVSTTVEGEDAVVRITDTGGGIPEDVRIRMFDPFFTTKDVGRGSGQGLPLARGVVQEGHGGSLTFDSVTGEGTTFVIRIPVEGRAPADQPGV
ncbi:two-component system sensor histidine kinase NtrB [Geodermatophilus chilensis]|uniref:two-component system sensor histidine kinase NtrB n=1 Tax=Geodermatophilus chilensis TaxID=2035835 RepID=UPI000C257F26|nr:ATP-binding protein [Geodermatophilus chilensis]